MKVAVIGAGYVGLTTSACLAEIGHSVHCIDVEQERIAALRRAEVPIYEPGLSELIGSHLLSRRLAFTTDAATGVDGAEVVFLAVGTPSGADGDIDLSFIEAAAASIAPLLEPQAIVAIKSTVVAGTARRVARLIAKERGRSDILVVSNPEFLREGSAIRDFLSADRIVIGADDRRGLAIMEQLYQPLTERGVPLITTETINAELTKYAANAFLALKIGFINDVADLCEALGGDVEAVARGIGSDARIGPAFLQAGPGYGGSCFPKDTRAYAATGARHGAAQPLVETLIARNDARKHKLARRIVAAVGPGKTVAVLGTAFKARTDDVREAAALTIVPALQKAGIAVRAHDPKARIAQQALPGVDWHLDPYEALRGADLLLLLTEWDEYRSLDLDRVARVMRGQIVMDFRNLLNPEAVTRAGLHYHSLGRLRRLPTSAHKGRGSKDVIAVAASPA